MNRRTVISRLGAAAGTALSWPLAAAAQPAERIRAYRRAESSLRE